MLILSEKKAWNEGGIKCPEDKSKTTFFGYGNQALVWIKRVVGGNP